MLKQIKNLGLGLLVGSMIVTAVPVQAFANDNEILFTPEFITREYDIPEGEFVYDANGNKYDHNGICVAGPDGKPVKNAIQPTERTTSKKDADIIVDIYTLDNVGKCSKEEEKMLRQYSKYRKIKNAAKEAYKEEARLYNEGYQAYPFIADVHDYDFTKLFPKYNDMSKQRQEAIEFVFTYYFNKAVNYKNTIQKCEDCGKIFVTNKLAAMYDMEMNCGCEHGLQLPKLTGAGLKAAWTRQDGTFKTGIELKDITIVKETDELITIKHEKHDMFGDITKTETIVYNKLTRIQKHVITRNN